VLDRLFQAAIRTGKKARAETGISEGGVSHGSAAAQVVRRIFDSLEGRRVLVVGAGQMATQAARAVAEVGEMDFAIANRTRAHAQALAAAVPHNADVHDLDELHDLLPRAHVVIFGGGASTISVAQLKTALKRRRDPLLVIDLGVPRYVEAAAGDLPGIFLYDLESLEQLVANALASRREAVPAVEALVQKELDEFAAWVRGRRAMPAIHTLNEWAESIRQSELAWLPEDLTPDMRARIDKLTKRLVKRLLGRAAARVVKGHGDGDPNLPTADDLRSVFGLDEGDNR
jgi:glutamyl-tRNA reductase